MCNKLRVIYLRLFRRRFWKCSQNFHCRPTEKSIQGYGVVDKPCNQGLSYIGVTNLQNKNKNPYHNNGYPQTLCEYLKSPHDGLDHFIKWCLECHTVWPINRLFGE